MPVKLASLGVAEKGTGDGSGAPAKSAKSANSQSRFAAYEWHAILPESPEGTADADGFAPPKRLLNKAAILCRDVNG
jgi:hypothetical protein